MSRVRRRLAPDVRAPGEARAFVASQCRGMSAEALDVMRLLTTEIVDNAMWHATPGPLWLDVESGPDRVAVGVTDGGGGEVRLAPDTCWPETGHGLRLVDALSARWGVEPAAEPPGKRVWFELPGRTRGTLPCRAPAVGRRDVTLAIARRRRRAARQGSGRGRVLRGVGEGVRARPPEVTDR